MKDLVKLNFTNELANILNTYHKENLRDGDRLLAHTPSRLIYEVLNSTTGLIMLSDSCTEDEKDYIKDLAIKCGNKFLCKSYNDFINIIKENTKEIDNASLMTWLYPLIISYCSQKILSACVSTEENILDMKQ